MSSITGRGAAGLDFDQRSLHQAAGFGSGFGGILGGYLPQSAMQQQQQQQQQQYPQLLPLNAYALMASFAHRGVQQGSNGFGK
jgi:hypothetical protein